MECRKKENRKKESRKKENRKRKDESDDYFFIFRKSHAVKIKIIRMAKKMGGK